MRTIQGKEVFDCFAEVVDPMHTALLILDMQNDFCAPNGKWNKHHVQGALDIDETVNGIARVLDAARKYGIMTVFIENTHLAGALDESPAYFYFLGKQGCWDMISEDVNTLDGTWGHETIAELKPAMGEAVIKKWGFSAFHKTVLDKLLRGNGIQTAVIVGEETNGCILTTARSAMYHDYYVVVLRDCVGSPKTELHEAALTLLKDQLSTSAEIITEWKKRIPGRSS